MRLVALLSGACYASSVLAWYDQNRAGAVLKAPSNDSFTSVSGTFTVPSLTGNPKLAIWVAIGESTLQNAPVRGGILYDKSFTSFAGWYPSNNTDTTSQAPVKGGDNVTVTVSLTGGNAATVILENKTQNKKATSQLTAPTTVDPVALQAGTADWFVQAFQSNGELVNVPSFGTISFTAVSGTLKSGKSVPPTGAGTFEIQGTSGQIYSKTTVSANGISVQRSQ